MTVIELQRTLRQLRCSGIAARGESGHHTARGHPAGRPSSGCWRMPAARGDDLATDGAGTSGRATVKRCWRMPAARGDDLATDGLSLALRNSAALGASAPGVAASSRGPGGAEYEKINLTLHTWDRT